jgi:hypothetical protein
LYLVLAELVKARFYSQAERHGSHEKPTIGSGA